MLTVNSTRPQRVLENPEPTMNSDTKDAVSCDIDAVVYRTVDRVVYGSVHYALHNAVSTAVYRPVYWAVYEAHPQHSFDKFLRNLGPQ